MTAPVSLMMTAAIVLPSPKSTERPRTAVNRTHSRSWDFSNDPIPEMIRCSSDSNLISPVLKKNSVDSPVCQLPVEHLQEKTNSSNEKEVNSSPIQKDFAPSLDQIHLEDLSLCGHSNDAPCSSPSENCKDDEQSGADAEETKQKAIEYVRKLNYSEAMIQQAVEQLGGKLTKDELLKIILEIQKNNPQEHEPEPESVPRIEHRAATPSNSLESDGSLPATVSEGDDKDLRYIVIDGSNVAICHGYKKVFSCRGIQLVVDWFVSRGHRVTAFVPSWRREEPRADNPIIDQEVLFELEKRGCLAFTPARRVLGKRVTSYDDLFIFDLAVKEDGIVVSNDFFRDLSQKKEEYKKIIEERQLMFTFAGVNNDRFMPPGDPLGRYGPTLENFLRKTPLYPDPLPPNCPYGAKCTYGAKCKYHHADRPHYKGSVKLGQSFPGTRKRTGHIPLGVSKSDSQQMYASQHSFAQVMPPRESSAPNVSGNPTRNSHPQLRRTPAIPLTDDHRLQPQSSGPGMTRTLQPLTSTMSADAAVYHPYRASASSTQYMAPTSSHLMPPPSHFNPQANELQALRNDISQRLLATFDPPKVAYIMCKYPDIYDVQQLAYLIIQDFPPS